MNTLPSLALSCSLLFAAAASAQVDRETSTLVDYRHLRQATLAEVQTWAAQGYRMSNFEVAAFGGSFTVNCSMVRNTGAYAAGWLFYHDKTGAELSALCSSHDARIVDLERYELNGQPTFAALLFVNSGQQQKAWSWHTGIPEGSIWTTMSGMGHRPIDIEPYSYNGQRYYHVVSIANTGSDNKAWWVYTDVTLAQVQGFMSQHDARLYDFEQLSVLPPSYACVLVRDDVRSITLWSQGYPIGFHTDLDHGGRVVGLAWQGLGSRAITLIDNMNPFATEGIGCVGTNGLTIHRGEGDAFTGTSVTYRTLNLRPWAPTFAVYGTNAMALPLAGMGAPGCTGYLSPIATELRFSNGSGIASDTIALPANPAFAGLELLSQMLALDPGANALGLTASNRLRTHIRHW